MDHHRWDPHAAVICPYDETHVLSVKRFQRHLVKCRQVCEYFYIICHYTFFLWNVGNVDKFCKLHSPINFPTIRVLGYVGVTPGSNTEKINVVNWDFIFLKFRTTQTRILCRVLLMLFICFFVVSWGLTWRIVLIE